MWNSIAAGVYEATMRLKNGWPLRSVAVAGSDGALVVYSPLPSRQAAEELAELGDVSRLVAANKYHHLGLKPFSNRFPEARVVGAPPTVKRCARQGVAVEPASSEQGITVLTPHGLKNGEVWLAVEVAGRRVWITGDAFFNVAASDVPRSMVGRFLRATKTVPGFRIGKTWNWAAVKKWDSYRDWVDAALTAGPPDLLIPAHGDIVEQPGPRMREALSSPGKPC